MYTGRILSTGMNCDGKPLWLIGCQAGHFQIGDV